MFGLRMKALTIGLAILTWGGTLAASISPAEAQRQYRRVGYPAGHYGVPIRPAVRTVYRRVAAPAYRRAYRPAYRRMAAPAYRRAYRPAYRRVAAPLYRPASYAYPRVAYGYRPASTYGYYGPRYRYGSRPARYYGYFGPRYRYPQYPYYRPATYYGHFGPRYNYGYYGYPYYRRSYNGGALAAGLISGLALGAIAATAQRVVDYQRPAYRNCWLERQRTVNRYGRVTVRRVRVCG